MSTIESRREFLKKSSILLGSAALFGSSALLTGCAQAQETAANISEQIPEHPYPYKALDAANAEKT